MKRVILSMAIMICTLTVSLAQCTDTLAEYFQRTYQLNLNGIQGSPGYVTGSNPNTSEIGNWYDFGDGQVTGAFIWWGAKKQVGPITPEDSFLINVYAVNPATNLPTGGRLGGTKIGFSDIDTVFTGFIGSNIYHSFNNPVSVSGPFAVTVQVDGAAIDDTIAILSNAQGDGLGEERAILRSPTGNWYALADVYSFGGGQPYDADIMILPTVTKDFSAVITPSSINVCTGGSFNLTATIYGCNSNYSVEWSGPGVTNPFNPTTSVNVSSGGSGTVTYNVQVIDIDNNDTITESITINIRNVGIDAGVDQSIPCNSTTDLAATLSGNLGAGTTIQWSNGVAGLLNNGVSPGTYTVTVTNPYGCTATDTVIVFSPTPQVVDFELCYAPAPDAGCVGYATCFYNTSSNLNGWNWTWSYGDADSSYSVGANGSFVYTVSNAFTVTLTGDSAGCSISYSKGIIILPASNSICISGGLTTCPASCFVGLVDMETSVGIYPNPNNGSFSIDLSAMAGSNASITVYNMNGEKVYAGENFTINSSPETISLHTTTDGIYFVRVEVDGEYFTKRVIIQ